MIWQLMRRDPVWSNRLQVAAIGAVAAYFVPHVGIGLLAFLTWMPWLGSRPEQRAAPHYLSLPILANQLFLARFLAQLSAMWMPLGAAAAVFTVTGRPVQDLTILAEMAGACSAITLIALSSRVRQATGSGWMPTIAQVIITVAAFPVHHFLGPLLAVALAAIASAVLFWNIWRQLPLAFEMAPGKDSPGSTPKAAAAAGTARAGFVPLAWMPILRWVFGWRTLLFMPAMVLQGFTGNWLFLAIFCLFPISIAMRVPWPFNLPIRRGALLALALGPWMLVLFSTVAIGSLRTGARDQDAWREPMKLPFEYWQFGHAPEIQAPWGERTQLETYHLLGLPIYNPYGSARENSTAFIEWQFRRATQAIYGRSIAYEDYQRHRLSVSPLVLRAPFPALNLAACAFWVGLMANLLLAGLHWRVRQITPYGQQAINGVFVLQMLLLFAISGGVGTPWSSVSTVSLVRAALLRIAPLLPVNAALATLVVLAPLAMLCWTASRLFEGIEPPPADALVQQR